VVQRGLAEREGGQGAEEWVGLGLRAGMACAAAAARCGLAQRAVARRAERTCLKNFESLLAGTPSRALDLGLLTGKLDNRFELEPIPKLKKKKKLIGLLDWTGWNLKQMNKTVILARFRNYNL